MSQVSIKYKCGTRVRIAHHPPTNGIVTAVIIRGRGRVYEVGHAGDNGPTNTLCDEVELEPCEEQNKFGFGKDS